MELGTAYAVKRVGNLLSISCPAAVTRTWTDYEIESVRACSGDVCTRASASAMLNGPDTQPGTPLYDRLLEEMAEDPDLKLLSPELKDDLARRTVAADLIGVLAAHASLHRVTGRGDTSRRAIHSTGRTATRPAA